MLSWDPTCIVKVEGSRVGGQSGGCSAEICFRLRMSNEEGTTLRISCVLAIPPPSFPSLSLRHRLHALLILVALYTAA